jgi:hypothetical protein
VPNGAAGATPRAATEDADGKTSSAGGARLTRREPVSTGPRAAMTGTAGREGHHAHIVDTIRNTAPHATAMTLVRSDGKFSRSQTPTETRSSGAGG